VAERVGEIPARKPERRLVARSPIAAARASGVFDLDVRAAFQSPHAVEERLAAAERSVGEPTYDGVVVRSRTSRKDSEELANLGGEEERTALLADEERAHAQSIDREQQPTAIPADDGEATVELAEKISTVPRELSGHVSLEVRQSRDPAGDDAAASGRRIRRARNAGPRDGDSRPPL
jgi:hypothetical protein